MMKKNLHDVAATGIIVSRHAGAVEWIARQMAGDAPVHSIDVHADCVDIIVDPGDGAEHVYYRVRVAASAAPSDVAGKDVWGNIPLDLAAYAASVTAILFPPGEAPRGQEYTAADMVAAGVYCARFGVMNLPEDRSLRDHLMDGGFTYVPPVPPGN